MPIRCMTGAARAVKPYLFARLREALGEENERPLIVLVPEQYTLQAEREIMEALDIPGSFRLHVLSPTRLFALIFQEAGSPEPTRVDERGRVMLMHGALKSLSRELTWYRGGQHRPGFAALAAEQVRELKQAGYTPEKLEALASATPPGALSYKLRDIVLIWKAYEEKLAGRFMDGEDEVFAALERIPRAGFLRGADVWGYGFELVSPTLAAAAVALSPAVREVTLLLPAQNDPMARDYYAFEPVARSLDRLRRLAEEKEVEWSRERIEEEEEEALPGREELEHLVREINSFPCRPYEGRPRSIRLMLARNPQDEAVAVMALVRQLVRERGWRYRDVAVGCFRLEEYAASLERAARLYGIPLFLESGRPAERNPLARYLLLALRLISANWPAEDVQLFLRTGYCDLSDGECDCLSDYIVECGIDGRMFTRPFRRGGEERALEAEALRLRALSPVLQLEEDMRAAQTLHDQLTALWRLLEEVGAFERLQARQEELTRMGRMEAANECAQVWNRVMGAMDQLAQLMAGPRLPARDLMELIRESLTASDIKPLPQSGDAVMAGSLSHLRTQPVKLLILMGANEGRPGDVGGLFLSEERELLAGEKGIWLAPDAMERGRLRDIDLNAALALARQYVVVTYAQSAADGSALLPGNMVSRLRSIFPQLTPSGGLSEGENLRRMKYAAPDAALWLLPSELSSGEMGESARAALSALNAMEERRGELEALKRALTHRAVSRQLPRELARRLYAGPRSVSVTRLERYAACPFMHFVEYGLRPKKLEPFEVRRQDDGTFYHDAMERFLREEWPRVEGMGEEEAMARMDRVSEELLAPLMDGPLGENPVSLRHSRRMREVARRAAAVATRHLAGSGFVPCALEVRFGEEDPVIRLSTGEGEVSLQGRVDRVDRWADGGEGWLRIIDYKSGADELNLTRLYFGLQLQLMVYLAAAMRVEAGRPAGAFYFRVADPLIATEERDREKVEGMRTDELRLNGLFIEDGEVLRAMSPDIEHTVKLSLKSDGTPKSSVRMVDEEGFRLLVEHALRAAGRIAEGIRQGNTDIAPVRLGSYCSCDRCDWQALCQRDVRLGGMPKNLPSLPQKEVLERIREEAEEK